MKVLPTLLLIFATISTVTFAENYYRYYDDKGVAVISRSITDTHIRRGYDVLDRTLNVVNHVAPYHVERDLNQSGARAAAAKQKAENDNFIRAYQSADSVKAKRDEVLKGLRQQWVEQVTQYQKLMLERASLLRKKAKLLRSGEPLPSDLQYDLNLNVTYSNEMYKTIIQLEKNYRQQADQYNAILAKFARIH